MGPSSPHYCDSMQQAAQAEDQLLDVYCPLDPRLVLAQTVVEILVCLQTLSNSHSIYAHQKQPRCNLSINQRTQPESQFAQVQKTFQSSFISCCCGSKYTAFS